MVNVYFNMDSHRGRVAQLGERIVRNDEAGGSIPPTSTTIPATRGPSPGKKQFKRAGPAKSERDANCAQMPFVPQGKPVLARECDGG